MQAVAQTVNTSACLLLLHCQWQATFRLNNKFRDTILLRIDSHHAHDKSPLPMQLSASAEESATHKNVRLGIAGISPVKLFKDTSLKA